MEGNSCKVDLVIGRGKKYRLLKFPQRHQSRAVGNPKFQHPFCRRLANVALTRAQLGLVVVANTQAIGDGSQTGGGCVQSLQSGCWTVFVSATKKPKQQHTWFHQGVSDMCRSSEQKLSSRSNIFNILPFLFGPTRSCRMPHIGRISSITRKRMVPIGKRRSKVIPKICGKNTWQTKQFESYEKAGQTQILPLQTSMNLQFQGSFALGSHRVFWMLWMFGFSQGGLLGGCYIDMMSLFSDWNTKNGRVCMDRNS